MASEFGEQLSTKNEFELAAEGVGGTGFDHLFSIRDYTRNIFRHWRLILIAALAGFMWAVYAEATSPKLYNVSVVVGPVGDAGTQSGASGLVSLFLSGGTMAAGPPEWGRYVFALSSVKLAEKLQREDGLLQKIFAGRWDGKAKTWRTTPGLSGRISRYFNRLFGLPLDPSPDTKSLAQYLSANVTLNTDKTTGISTLGMMTPDPKRGLGFVLMVHNAAVDLVRSEIAERNKAKVNFVLDALNRTTNADQRGVLIGMLAQTEQTQMLLNNHLPFAAQIIDTPTVPTQPAVPKPLQILMIYNVGFLVFVVLLFIAIDQIASTNIVAFIEAKIVSIPRATMEHLAQFREYGWRGVFKRA